MLGDAEEAQREAMALGPLGRGSRGLLYWASCSEDKKDGQGQGKKKSWEVETYRERGEKEAVEVPEVTLEQECYSFGGIEAS